MYLSKIWFFLVAVAAGVALTIALLMPRPAARQAVDGETDKLKRACKITTILLKDNARNRVQLAGEFARTGAPAGQATLRLDSILYNASRGEIISVKENETGRKALASILDPKKAFKNAKIPDFVLLLDNKGRVVARSNKGGDGNDKFGESLRGYFLVDDALAGYMRDDLWLLDGKLYRVAASPVVTVERFWAGAVVIGQALDNDFAGDLAKGLGANLAFFAGGDQVAASESVAINKEVLAESDELPPFEPGKDCESPAFQVDSGGKTYSVILSRLPGEAGLGDAFVSTFIERKASTGFMGALKQIRKGDLAFSSFPWIAVILGFLVMLGVGLFLMIWESDKPLRRLTEDAQRLAKGGDKMVEESHSGKFGSIARSVNVALDRLRREAKSAQKDLDDLLGPAPVGGAVAMPSMNPGAMPPPPPPPPSEFRFSDEGKATHQSLAAPPPPLNLPPPPPPMSLDAAPPTQAQVKPRPVSLPGAPVVSPIDTAMNTSSPDPTEALTVERMTPQVEMVEDMPTIVSEQSQKLADKDAETRHFREIYEEFLTTKRRCGEGADNLNFERFATKLRKNRDALIAKHGCRSVRFQVYVKDGKAALKASPEK